MNFLPRIKRATGTSLAASLTLALVSCEPDPEERFHWSPDGSRAGVLSNGSLLLLSDEGTVDDTFGSSDEDPGELEVQSFGWLPDGEGLWVHRTRTLATWNELRPLLPKEQALKIERLSKAMPLLFSAMAACYDPESDENPMLEKVVLEEEIFLAALAHAMATNPESLAEALQDSPELQEEFKSDQESPLEEWELHELVYRKGNASTISNATPANVVLRTLSQLGTIKASPSQPVIAITRSPGFLSDTMRLEIHALDGSLRHQVEERESEFDFAWKPDGLSLVIMVSNGDDQFHTIRHQSLLHESGQKLTAEEEKSTVLAKMFSYDGPWLEVLPSGAILFSSTPSSFPALLIEDSDTKPRLYQIMENGNTMKTMAVQGDSLPDGGGHFVVSPDGKRVAIVETSSDSVSVLELESGKITLVSPEHSEWKCRTLPAWRSDTELSFAAPDSESKSIQWQLWNAETLETEVLSGSWPEGTTAGWLARPEPEKTTPTEP